MGFHALHPDVAMNFQMNRFWHWAGEARMLDELRDAAPRIRSYDDWMRELLALSDRALSEGRALAAAYYARAAEFFMAPDDPRRQPARARFLELVAREYGVAASERHAVPYEGRTLPAYRFTPRDVRGRLVAFGGFDGYIEERLPMLRAFEAEGLDVVAFEGPGQGSVLEEGLPMTIEWGRPVRAVLDHFGLDDVTLVGFSLGGCLVMHGAAGEPRVRRVVANDVLTDFVEVAARQANPAAGRFMRWAHVVPAAGLNLGVALARRRNRVVDWGIRHGMRVFGARNPAEYLRRMRAFRTAEISARVTQDVLLLAGVADHFVPFRQLGDQLVTLTNARSVTAHAFTEPSEAKHHCGIGDLGSVIRVIVEWLRATGGLRSPARLGRSGVEADWPGDAARAQAVRDALGDGHADRVVAHEHARAAGGDATIDEQRLAGDEARVVARQK
jgi:alpha-beta hydrolase superfamily lysophospholipase